MEGRYLAYHSNTPGKWKNLPDGQPRVAEEGSRDQCCLMSSLDRVRERHRAPRPRQLQRSPKKSYAPEEGPRGTSRELPTKIWILHIPLLLGLISWGMEVVGLVEATDVLSMC